MNKTGWWREDFLARKFYKEDRENILITQFHVDTLSKYSDFQKLY